MTELRISDGVCAAFGGVRIAAPARVSHRLPSGPRIILTK
jgi:hypothetical protein